MPRRVLKQIIRGASLTTTHHATPTSFRRLDCPNQDRGRCTTLGEMYCARDMKVKSNFCNRGGIMLDLTSYFKSCTRL